MNHFKNHMNQVKAEDSLKEETKSNVIQALREPKAPSLRSKKTFSLVWMTATLAACVLLFSISYGYYSTPLHYLSLDINPSLELGINFLDRVVSTRAFNHEGEQLLQSDALHHQPLETAVSRLVALASEKGYLAADGSTTIALTAISDQPNALEKIAQQGEAGATLGLAATQSHAQLYHAQMSLQQRTQAMNSGISPGKYRMIGQLQELDPQQEMEQWQDRTQTNISDEDRLQARQQMTQMLEISADALQLRTARMEQAQQFSDTVEHWAREQVQNAQSWGLTNGYPDGSFNPDGKISGTEGILMMSRMMNCIAGEDTTGGNAEEIQWQNVPEWAHTMLQEPAALRIATQSHIYGETQLNRLQFAVALAKGMSIEPMAVPEGTVVFLDQEEIPADALGYIYALRTLGIIEGNEGQFFPNLGVTRAEAATMLNRVMTMVPAE